MKSMTGFAQGRRSGSDFSMFVSFKSYNHRFLDLNFRGTGITPQFEKTIKELLRQKVYRGKIEIMFDFFETNPRKWDIQFNEMLLDEILEKVVRAKKKYKGELNLSLDSLLRFPMIFHLDYRFEDIDEKKSKQIRKTIEDVFREFLQSRITEGESIFKDMQTSIQKIGDAVKVVEKSASKLERENFQRLKERIMKVVNDIEIDEKRVAQEAAIAAEKSCIVEEVNRLKLHNKKLLQLGKDRKTNTKGREMDFLCQEMQRETYTIGSKINSMNLHDHILLIRREIEKIRQQIQNVE
jgi:uncharacterized protein (TIGR00255 family)